MRETFKREMDWTLSGLLNSCFMDVGAVARRLRSLAAFEGLGGLEFRVPVEVSRWFFAAIGFNPQNLAAPKADPQPFRSQMIQ